MMSGALRGIITVALCLVIPHALYPYSFQTIAAAALGLSLLAGSTVFAQDSTTTTKKEKKVKHKKNKTGGETSSTTEKSK